MTVWCDAPIDIDRLVHWCESRPRTINYVWHMTEILGVVAFQSVVADRTARCLNEYLPISDEDVYDNLDRIKRLASGLQFMVVRTNWMANQIRSQT